MHTFESFSLQAISKQFISQSMDLCRALVWVNAHDDLLEKFTGVPHTPRVLKIQAVDGSKQHGKASGHISEVM